jgi:plastocyanin
MTITNAGVMPVEITIAVGGRVLFVNNDIFAHDVAGGPDPSRPDCPEINEVGFIAPGQSRQTAPFPAARTCEFHDHAHYPHVFGRIVVR